MKYTYKNNVLMATLTFMNESNYKRAFQGFPITIVGFTGQALRKKKLDAKNKAASKIAMKKQWGAYHYNQRKLDA